MSEMTVRCVGVRYEGKLSWEGETYHNRMDWRMEAQSFTNDTVENREFLHFFVRHGAKSSVRIREMFQLFLIQSLAEKTVNRG